ncbi:uncharacterized protein LOC112877599 isoform X3 [Panicum hallii]|nr:uncharacterized protein LOC112877599 isoform X3 [Panicum hallii]
MSSPPPPPPPFLSLSFGSPIPAAAPLPPLGRAAGPSTPPSSLSIEADDHCDVDGSLEFFPQSTPWCATSPEGTLGCAVLPHHRQRSITSLDLNSQAGEFPYLAEYQNILESPELDAEFAGGNRSSDSSRGGDTAGNGRNGHVALLGGPVEMQRGSPWRRSMRLTQLECIPEGLVEVPHPPRGVFELLELLPVLKGVEALGSKPMQRMTMKLLGLIWMRE